MFSDSQGVAPRGRRRAALAAAFEHGQLSGPYPRRVERRGERLLCARGFRSLPVGTCCVPCQGVGSFFANVSSPPFEWWQVSESSVGAGGQIQPTANTRVILHGAARGDSKQQKKQAHQR